MRALRSRKTRRARCPRSVGRRLALVAAAASALAVGGVLPGAAAAAAPAVPAAAPRCGPGLFQGRVVGVQVRPVRRLVVDLGQPGRPCLAAGFPVVRLLGGDGNVIAVRARRGADPALPVLLRSGTSARVEVEARGACAAPQRVSALLVVVGPGRRVLVHLPPRPALLVCAGAPLVESPLLSNGK